MSKRNVLLILCALLLSLSLGAAVAEESRTVVWRVTAPAINAEALQTETFGTDLSAVQEEKREYDSLFWSLTGEGIPFCGIDHNRGAENMQARFDIYRHADAGEERTYYYNLDTRGIRACNQFLKNARTDVIGNAAKAGDDNKLGDRWIAEARAIRAILTFDMACWFGDTPIFVTGENEPYIMNTSDPMPDRSSFTDVVDWIVSECDAIKNALPFRYQNEDFYLIGYEEQSLQRNIGTMTTTSDNYLTWKRKVRTENIFEDEGPAPKEKWSTLPRKALEKLGAREL